MGAPCSQGQLTGQRPHLVAMQSLRSGPNHPQTLGKIGRWHENIAFFSKSSDDGQGKGNLLLRKPLALTFVVWASSTRSRTVIGIRFSSTRCSLGRPVSCEVPSPRELPVQASSNFEKVFMSWPPGRSASRLVSIGEPHRSNISRITRNSLLLRLLAIDPRAQRDRLPATVSSLK